MPEVAITGAEPITYPYMATWHWEVPIYLFLGGLVAGLMIFGAAFRLLRVQGFSRAIWVTDVASLPLLALGLLMLWLDLANRWNAWRFFTTFQVASAMSWGSWILLFAMIVLALRLVVQLPSAPTLTAGEEETGFRRRMRRWVVKAWHGLTALARAIQRRQRALDLATIVLGLGLGFYTGILLSTIAARPLWNSSVLAPLFLVSGMASGGAFLCLFISKDEHMRLVPYSILLCGIEFLLILAYVLALVFGSLAAQQAGAVLLSGAYAIVLWGLVVVLGLLAPATIESMELVRRHIPTLLSRLAPILKLSGGVALRFVVVYAGLQTFI